MTAASLLLSLLLAFPAAALNVPAGAASAILKMPDGSKVEAELALTPQMQARGLMYRRELPEGKGMLFVFPEDGPRVFWMKNTFIPLDIVFLDAALKVRNVYHRVPASREDTPELEVAKVSAPAACVLELPSGSARRYGLKPGARIEASFVSGIKKSPAPVAGSGKKKK